MCVLSIKVPIRKKSGNLLCAPCKTHKKNISSSEDDQTHDCECMGHFLHHLDLNI